MVLGELEANRQRQGKLPAHRRRHKAISEGVLAMFKSLLCVRATMKTTMAWYNAGSRAAWQAIGRKAPKSLLAPVLPGNAPETGKALLKTCHRRPQAINGLPSST
jgi:hypothetical protein